MDTRILLIGGGNMARAIVAGALQAGHPADRFLVVEPNPHRRAGWTDLACPTFTDACDALSHLSADDQVLLAVKPQTLDDAVAGLAHMLGDRVVISILAGTPSTAVRARLPSARVIRVMPNTPARVRQGTTAVALGDGARPGDERCALALFQAVGEVFTIDESLMDAFTALAGSGPAYLFYLAQAMARGGRDVGFDDHTALRIVRSVIAGSAALLAESDEDPADLRAAVTSKGGTTEAAIAVLDGAGVMATWARAIVAARDRGRELASSLHARG